MKQLKGILRTVILILSVIVILDLLGVIDIPIPRDAYLISGFALVGILMTLTNTKISLKLIRPLQIIFCIIFMAGIVTVVIPTNMYVTISLIMLVAVLVLISTLKTNKSRRHSS
jgi:hypothetical protein